MTENMEIRRNSGLEMVWLILFTSFQRGLKKKTHLICDSIRRTDLFYSFTFLLIQVYRRNLYIPFWSHRQVSLFLREAICSFRYIMHMHSADRWSAVPCDCRSCGDVFMCRFTQPLWNWRKNRCDLSFSSLLLCFLFKWADVLAFVLGVMQCGSGSFVSCVG